MKRQVVADWLLVLVSKEQSWSIMGWIMVWVVVWRGRWGHFG
jgi:hypothetical protein